MANLSINEQTQTLEIGLTSPPKLNSFYKRLLPPSCIAFNSSRGKDLFKGALDENNMESYFTLSLQFLTQSEPAYCGLGTLCMILNALQVDPMRQWKGVWRWYDENMLDCCRPLEQVKEVGVTLPEFTCLARCNGLNVIMRRADQTSKDQFLQDIKRTSKTDSEYLAVSFSRQALGQTGEGHFSPIGGYAVRLDSFRCSYNEKENMVLVLDVARFKYPSYWVSVDLLWESLHPHDGATRRPRGYAVLSKGNRAYLKSAFSHLSLNFSSWPRLAETLFQDLPEKCSALPPNPPITDFLSLVVSSIPDEFDSIVEDRLSLFTPPFLGKTNALSPTDAADGESLKEYLQGLDKLLQQVSSTKLYQIVSKSLAMKKKLERIDSNPSVYSLFENINVQSPMIDGALIDGVPLEIRRLRSVSGMSMSRRDSFASIVPPSQNVNDFIAFLTMFLLALFSYYPLYEKVQKTDTQELKVIFDLSHLPEPLSTEVQLLKDQIAALMECCCKANTP